MKRFLQHHFKPGGTLFLLECNYCWPATQVSDRHFFQVGGKGCITPEEYIQGSPRVTDFLKRQGSPHTRWNAPLLELYFLANLQVLRSFR